jgi:kynureninase
VSQRQVSLLRSRFESIDAPAEVAFVEPMPEERRAGFLAIRAPEAVRLARRLRERGVHADARGTVLRLGPAPYLRDDQLTDAIDALAEVLRDR